MRRRSNITNASNDDFNCEYHQVSQVELDEKVPPRSQNPGPESQGKAEVQGKAEIQKVQGKAGVQKVQDKGKAEVQKVQSKTEVQKVQGKAEVQGNFLDDDSLDEGHHLARLAKRKFFYSELEGYLKSYQKDFSYMSNAKYLPAAQKEISRLAKGMANLSFPFKIPEYQHLQEYVFLAHQEVVKQKLLADAKAHSSQSEDRLVRDFTQVKGTIRLNNVCIRAQNIVKFSFGDNKFDIMTTMGTVTVVNDGFSQEGFKLYYEYLVAHWQYCLDD